MNTKQLTTLVATVTVLINLILFAAGFSTTLTCTLARVVQTAYAAVTTPE